MRTPGPGRWQICFRCTLLVTCLAEKFPLPPCRSPSRPALSFSLCPPPAFNKATAALAAPSHILTAFSENPQRTPSPPRSYSHPQRRPPSSPTFFGSPTRPGRNDAISFQKCSLISFSHTLAFPFSAISWLKIVRPSGRTPVAELVFLFLFSRSSAFALFPGDA